MGQGFSLSKKKKRPPFVEDPRVLKILERFLLEMGVLLGVA